MRRAFEEYATARLTKEQPLKKVRAWVSQTGATSRSTSQAIGMLLRNQLYVGIVDVRVRCFAESEATLN